MAKALNCKQNGPREGTKPLGGIRVLAVEAFGAGPYGTMFLADLGAEVIKIENGSTGGDPARYFGPYHLGEADSEHFQSWNLGKRSLRLDLKTPADRAVFLHIAAYGRDNERKSWPGYDFLMQAEAGLMSVTGEPDGPPTKFGPSIIDYMTGITGVVGLLSCLIRARQTGQGCDVDACLFDVAMHQMSYTATWHLNHGHVTDRERRSGHFSVAPVQTFPTADGWIFVMCMTEKFWLNLLGAMQREDLAKDDRFGTIASRFTNRVELSDLLDAEFRKRSTEEWLALLSGLLPVAPVYDMVQAFANPFVAQTGMVRDIEHPENASLKILASPLKIDGERPPSLAAAPLGADNGTLLQPDAEPSLAHA